MRCRLAALLVIAISTSIVQAQIITGTGVITGFIRDDGDNPIPYARVSAMHRAKRWNGPLEARHVGRSVETDDRGMFRLHSLPPGDFIVSATTERVSSETSGYFVTYYPSTIALNDARPISVAEGTEAQVSIVIRPVPLIPVSGVARMQNGEPAAGFVAELVPEPADSHQSTGPTGRAVTSTTADGSFLLRAKAGRYTLAVHNRGIRRPAQPQQAERLVTVAGESVSGLEMTTSVGATVSGRLGWEGTGVQPWPRGAPLGRIRAARVNTTLLYDAKDVEVAADGTFRFDDLHGLYRFQSMGLLFFLDVLRVEGPPDITTSRGLEFKPGTVVDGLRIVVTNRLGRLLANVTDGDRAVAKANVYVLPDVPTADTPNAIGLVALGSPGVTISDLREGTYLVVAIDIAGSYLTQDTVLMEQARAAATRVPIQRHASTTIDVPLTRLGAAAARLCGCRVPTVEDSGQK